MARIRSRGRNARLYLNSLNVIFVRSATTNFGHLKFRRSYGFIGKGFWTGRAFFRPVNDFINVRFVAGRSGVTELQFGYFREIEEKYPNLVDAVENALVDTPMDYFGPELFPDLKWDDYKLDWISIPISMLAPNTWSLSYEFLRLPGQTFSVVMEEWKPLYAELDD